MLDRSYVVVWGSRASVNVTLVTSRELPLSPAFSVRVSYLHDYILEEICEDATLLTIYEVGDGGVGRKVDLRGEYAEPCWVCGGSTLLNQRVDGYLYCGDCVHVAAATQPCWVCGVDTALNPKVDGVQSLGYCGCEG